MKIVLITILAFISIFGFIGPSIGEIKMPSATVIDDKGNIYVLSGISIYKYASDGGFLKIINDKMGDIFGEIESSGNRYISVTQYVDGKRTLIGKEITPKEIIDFASYLQTMPTIEAIIEKVIYPEWLTKGPDGNIYIIGEDIFRKNYKVGIIDPIDGHTISVFGNRGTGEAGLWYPKNIAVDAEGNIYVTNQVYSDEGDKLFAVKKYDRQGNFIKGWGHWGGGNGEFKDPRAIAVDDKNGYVYVTDAFTPPVWEGDHPQKRINKFTKEGEFIKNWGGDRIVGLAIIPPTFIVDPDFLDPIGVVVDSESNIYILENYRSRVTKFNENGNKILQWGRPGTGEGEFIMPEGFAIDANNNIYIADTSNNRIQKFDSNGKFLMEIK